MALADAVLRDCRRATRRGVLAKRREVAGAAEAAAIESPGRKEAEAKFTVESASPTYSGPMLSGSQCCVLQLEHEFGEPKEFVAHKAVPSDRHG
jgi:hypothetical protein